MSVIPAKIESLKSGDCGVGQPGQKKKTCLKNNQSKKPDVCGSSCSIIGFITKMVLIC
jgi:hypothetical protein